MMRSPVVVAAVWESPPPTAANCASVPAATTTISRGQSGPQNEVTASAASSSCAEIRRSSGAVRSPRPTRRTVRPSCSVCEVDDRCGCGQRRRRGDGRTGRAADPVLPTRRSAQTSSAIRSAARVVLLFACESRSAGASAVPSTVSSGGRCRSARCPPGRRAPACRRSTRAPSFRCRCRSPCATRRSSS